MAKKKAKTNYNALLIPVAGVALVAIIILATRDKTEASDNGELPSGTVKTQLGSCWNAISGAGNQDGAAIWVVRNGDWIKYDTAQPIDEIGGFRSGEEVQLKASASCAIQRDEGNIPLSPGWNTFIW